MRGFRLSWNLFRTASLVAATALFVLTIEWGRRSGTSIPIPFLLLYASVVLSGGSAGTLAGFLSGTLAAAYVIYAASVGFGPRTLTGGELQAGLGVLLYLGTGWLLGRVRTQRDRYLQDIQRHQSELESEIEKRTADLRKNQEALTASEETFRQMAENISEIFWMTDVGKQEMIYVSPAYERIWQKSRQSLYDKPLSFLEAIHPDDRERVRAALATQVDGNYDEEYRILQPDGSTRWLRDRAFPIKSETGVVYRITGISEDLTDRKATEEQLRQSQKMEMVGQLTGGIAHDFNNLLAVVLGNLEFLQDGLADECALRAYLDRALAATQRGADLTHRLLAFSRKQSLAPEVIDLDQRVAGMLDMLSRTLGETIEVEVVRSEDLWHCVADPGQLENVIVNLTVNARDAMPEGGKLTVEVANARFDDEYAAAQAGLEAGEYVMLAVSDNGRGMSENELMHAFEPFFTTKPVGQGTGLGLSMAYGFAKQSGGHATIYSEEGHGTTVKIYLPRTSQPCKATVPSADPTEPQARGETVLIVEDDSDLRALAGALLDALGYRSFDAGTASSAMNILKREPGIDLLFTDVVLPGGMNGPTLAEHARRLRPDIKILYMSGYTENAALGGGDQAQQFVLLRKPFRKRDLALKLRQALDGSTDGKAMAPSVPGPGLSNGSQSASDRR